MGSFVKNSSGCLVQAQEWSLCEGIMGGGDCPKQGSQFHNNCEKAPERIGQVEELRGGPNPPRVPDMAHACSAKVPLDCLSTIDFVLRGTVPHQIAHSSLRRPLPLFYPSELSLLATPTPFCPLLVLPDSTRPPFSLTKPPFALFYSSQLSLVSWWQSGNCCLF